MELFVPSFEGERKRSTRPAMRVLTAGTARAYIHDLLPPRPLSGRPVTPDTPFILLILRTVGLKFFVNTQWRTDPDSRRGIRCGNHALATCERRRVDCVRRRHLILTVSLPGLHLDQHRTTPPRRYRDIAHSDLRCCTRSEVGSALRRRYTFPSRQFL